MATIQAMSKNSHVCNSRWSSDLIAEPKAEGLNLTGECGNLAFDVRYERSIIHQLAPIAPLTKYVTECGFNGAWSILGQASTGFGCRQDPQPDPGLWGPLHTLGRGGLVFGPSMI
jgi:hypothetical protein